MAAVLACDNNIPPLLSDAETRPAFRSCYRCLRHSGVAVFSVRDYAAIERKHPDLHLMVSGAKVEAVFSQYKFGNGMASTTIFVYI